MELNIGTTIKSYGSYFRAYISKFVIEIIIISLFNCSFGYCVCFHKNGMTSKYSDIDVGSLSGLERSGKVEKVKPSIRDQYNGITTSK
jgi:hypothetical protein